MVDKERELQSVVRELGEQLRSPPSDVDELLSLLDKLEGSLSKVDQSPTQFMTTALQPAITSLIAKDLLEHDDVDIRVAVASCISEITRITAPEAPYDDDVMRDVFKRIVESFEKLDDISSRSYAKRVAILETVGKVRSCVVMLDLECDDLILEMFHHFMKTITSRHPDNVVESMQTIMNLVIEESEDVSKELVSCLLETVKKDREASPSFKLGEKVIDSCGEKIKPTMLELLDSRSLNEYSSVVVSLCQGSHDVTANMDNSAVNMGDDKLSERTISDEIPQGSMKSEQDVSFPEDNGAPQKSSKGGMSNGIAELGNGESTAVPASPEQKPVTKVDDGEDVPGPASPKQNLAADIGSSNPLVGPSSPKQKPERSRHSSEAQHTSSDKNESRAEKPEKLSELCGKKGQKAGQPASSSTKSRPQDFSADGDKETPVVSDKRRKAGRKASTEQSDTPGQPDLSESVEVKNTSKLDKVTNSRKESTPDQVSPRRRGRPPGSGKSAAAKNKQAQEIDSSKVIEGTGDSEGSSMSKVAKESSKNGSGKIDVESSKKKEKTGLKKQTDVKPAVDDSEDISLKEMVSPRSSRASLGKNKAGKEESGRSKRRRGDETEEGDGPKSKSSDKDLVGARIKVWWPDDKMFYHGVVDSFDSSAKKHKVVYDDGDVEILFLKNEVWEYSDQPIKETKNEEAPENAPELASDGRHAKRGKSGLNQSSKEAVKVEVPKSDKELTGSPDEEPQPKRRGRPRGRPSLSAISNEKTPVSTTGKGSRGKAAVSKDDEMPKSTGNAKKEAASSQKDESTKPGKRAKLGDAKPMSNKNKDDSTTVTPKPGPGRKPKAKQTPETGDKAKSNGDTLKHNINEEKSDAEPAKSQGAGTSTGKKRKGRK